jgi:hypothetical protein
VRRAQACRSGVPRRLACSAAPDFRRALEAPARGSWRRFLLAVVVGLAFGDAAVVVRVVDRRAATVGRRIGAARERAIFVVDVVEQDPDAIIREHRGRSEDGQ